MNVAMWIVAGAVSAAGCLLVAGFLAEGSDV